MDNLSLYASLTSGPTKCRLLKVMSSEYLLVKDAVSQSASILWKTELDFTKGSSRSGTALCVGTPTDRYVKAPVFRNFQKPFTSFDDAGSDRKCSRDNDCYIKGWSNQGDRLSIRRIRSKKSRSAR